MRKFLATVALLLAFTSVARAEFPEKPIRLTVTFAAGGGTDLVARALAKAAEKHLGQSITVINKTGGSGAVGFADAAVQKPDGYNLVMFTIDIVYLPKMGLSRVTAADFEPIACVNQDNSVLLALPTSRFQSAKELIDHGRANPGDITYAVGGSTINFYLVSLGIDVKFNRVTYSGAAETMPALLGGHVDVTLMTPGEAFPQIQSGQVRALAIAAEKRLNKIPDVPTFAEIVGHPVVGGTWRGIAVPKGTPEPIKAKLEEAFLKAAQDPEFINFMEDRALGINVMDRAKFNEFIAEQDKAIGQVVEAIKKEEGKK